VGESSAPVLLERVTFILKVKTQAQRLLTPKNSPKKSPVQPDVAQDSRLPAAVTEEARENFGMA
jgi:hypothetical protein